MRVLIIFLFFSYFIRAELKDNYSVLDSLTKSQANQISEYLKQQNKKEFELFLISPYNTIIFESNLNQIFNDYELLNISGEDSLKINVIKYGVRYDAIIGDSLERTIEIKSYLLNKTFENKFTDFISREDIARIETANFYELKAVMPKRKLSLWEKIMEPFVVIGSMLVFVLLLFNVRS
jgi:hypothetical protein